MIQNIEIINYKNNLKLISKNYFLKLSERQKKNSGIRQIFSKKQYPRKSILYFLCNSKTNINFIPALILEMFTKSLYKNFIYMILYITNIFNFVFFFDKVMSIKTN